MAEPIIVVVDDDAPFLNFMHEVLTEEGYRTILLGRSDGVEAAVRELPDLLILDLRLEQATSGWALLQRIRADASIRYLPVIVCSADGRFLSAQAALLETMNCAWLEKPFDVDTLLSLVATIIAPATERIAGQAAQ